jgi:uncharacterized protein DUF5655/uncharacterized protein DUF4287
MAMSSVDDALKSQIRNIETEYGRPIGEWIEVVRASGKTKHGDVVSMLKDKYAMTHGAAHRVSLVAREALGKAPNASGTQTPAVDALYAGKKAALRPIHDKLLASILAMGNDIEIAPKKGYVSLRRRKQFAMIKPAAGHLDVGLILEETAMTARLESAATFNALFTHRVRLSDPRHVDRQLMAWLKRAYAGAG